MLGADLAWLMRPLVASLVETSNVPALRVLLPHTPSLLAYDTPFLEYTVKAYAYLQPQLAWELLRALHPVSPAQVTPDLVQLVIDAFYGSQQRTDFATQGEVDVLRELRAMKIAPTQAQVTQVLRWLLARNKLASAAQLFDDVRANTHGNQAAPMIAQLHSEFLLHCAEIREGNWVMTMLQKKVRLTDEEYTQVVKRLLEQNMIAVALDVMRWLNAQATGEFGIVRNRILDNFVHDNNAHQLPQWIQTLQTMA
jgi:hypothetical protein